MKMINTSPSIIGITGTPGTGKRSVGQILAKNLNYKFIHLNQITLKSDAVVSINKKVLDVDTDKLRDQVLKQIVGGNIVLVGHLLPHIISKDKLDLVIVLRCSPEELNLRYSARGYSDSKIKDNVMSEILDICFAEALNTFGTDSLYEFDTTRKKPIEIAKEIEKIFYGHKKQFVERINWMSKIVDEDSIQKYLA